MIGRTTGVQVIRSSSQVAGGVLESFVRCNRPRDDTTTGPQPTVSWIAHGSALVRFAPEHLRAETPRECHARLQHIPHTACTASVETTLRQALHPVRGPVRFLDLFGDPAFADATADKNEADEPKKTDGDAVEALQQDAPKDEDEGAAAAADTEQQQPHEPQQQQMVTEPHLAAAEATGLTNPRMKK